jgi:hypothetical protein
MALQAAKNHGQLHLASAALHMERIWSAAEAR